MSAEWIRVSLRAWAPDQALRGEFVSSLGPTDGLTVQVSEEPGQAELVYFVDEEMGTHVEASEPSAAFAAAVQAGLAKAAEWLRGRPEGVFDRCRAKGMDVDVFVGSWIDQDQFDLDLPSAFLLECGRAGLGISIVTND